MTNYSYSVLQRAVLLTCLWFSSVEVCLNENFAKRHIFTDVTQSRLHCLSSTQNTHSTDLTHTNTYTRITWVAYSCSKTGHHSCLCRKSKITCHD